MHVYDHFTLIARAASLGGVESLASMPVYTSQWGHTDEQLREAGISKGMIRLSVGLEDPEDIIADLDQALGALLLSVARMALHSTRSS